MQATLLLSVIAGAMFVWLSGSALPELVASHFGASGSVTEFMSRDAYLRSMLAMVVVLPYVVAGSGRLASVLPARLVNLPNKAYWLAPERRAATFHSLAHRAGWLAVLLVPFLCFVHWIILQANTSGTNQLPRLPFFVAVAVFLAAMLGWAAALHRRFRTIPL